MKTLLDRHLDGDLAEADRPAFIAWLNAAPENRFEFACAIQDEQTIREHFATAAATAALPVTTPHRRRLRFLPWLAAAAGLMLAAAGIGYAVLRYPAARLTGGDPGLPARPERGAVLLTGTRPAELRLGGYCRIELAPETEAVMEGQPRQEQLYLKTGELRCEVNSGKGAFMIRTDAGRVRVTGTRFTVRILSGEENPQPREKGIEPMQTKMLVQVLAGTVMVAGSWGERALAAGDSATLPPAPAAVTSPAPQSNLPTAGVNAAVTIAHPLGATANGGFVQKPNVAPNAAPLAGNRPAGAGADVENVVTIKLTDIPLTQYCSFLSSMANLPVTCDPALADRKISVDLNEVSVLEAADAAAAQVAGKATVITSQTPVPLGTVPGPKIRILIAPLPGK